MYNKNDSIFVYLALFLKTTSEGTAGKKGTPTSSLLTDLAVNIFKELELKENDDFTVIENRICLYTHLELRDKFNALFVRAGMDVRKVNLCEENLEEFFTRFISNN